MRYEEQERDEARQLLYEQGKVKLRDRNLQAYHGGEGFASPRVIDEDTGDCLFFPATDDLGDEIVAELLAARRHATEQEGDDG